MITKLKPNEIFVFGSNTQGIHGAGAARQAYEQFGAIWGQASGLQGQSYAIITKNLVGNRRVDPELLTAEIDNFRLFALSRPELIFRVTPIGTGLAGISLNQIQQYFTAAAPWPSNVDLTLIFGE